jgi:hypothetical protein
MTNPEFKIADALRIDANDLPETLLAVADPEYDLWRGGRTKAGSLQEISESPPAKRKQNSKTS